MNRTVLAALMLSFCVSMPAFGHVVDMAQKVRAFGISAGNAYVCVAAEDKATFKAESEFIYAMTLDELGPELAYIYAVSVGFGAAVDGGKLDCKKLATHWTDMKVEFGMEAKK